MIEKSIASAFVAVSHTIAPSKSQSYIDSAKQHLLQNYKQQPIVLERGDGVMVYDAEGKAYLDLIGGIATCALGHCHPDVVKAAKAQLDSLWHVSNVFYSEPQIRLAERLTLASGLKDARAFFCNSGAEANEALLKLARRFHSAAGRPQRFETICFHSSFHGRTLATVTATGQAKYQQGFEPLPPGFLHVEYGNLDAVRSAISEKTAAILVEPIQGEGGVRSAPEGFLRGLRTLCDEHGLLLLIDEVQTGIGRTGKPFAFQHDGVLPDAFSLAKSLGNGLPIGAMVCSDAVGKALPSGSHGSTFGGNPVAAAAACATWDIACSTPMLESVSRKGQFAQQLLKAVQQRHPTLVKEVRGRGMLFGAEVEGAAADVVARCRAHGLLAPAYIVTEAQLKDGVERFEKALTA
jgi:acetylornithine/N-succinyldiaminopimelate aminotransferase